MIAALFISDDCTVRSFEPANDGPRGAHCEVRSLDDDITAALAPQCDAPHLAVGDVAPTLMGNCCIMSSRRGRPAPCGLVIRPSAGQRRFPPFDTRPFPIVEDGPCRRADPSASKSNCQDRPVAKLKLQFLFASRVTCPCRGSRSTGYGRICKGCACPAGGRLNCCIDIAVDESLRQRKFRRPGALDSEEITRIGF